MTFQVTFTELFIAATVLTSVGYRRGWRSVALGSALGAIAIALVSYGLGSVAEHLPLRLLDWISAALLLGFGLFLLYEYRKSHLGTSDDNGYVTSSGGPAQSLNVAGIAVAAWAMFAEGAEIMVVWLGISIKQGMATASMGVLIGAVVLLLIAAVLGKSGIFRRIPTKYLDLIAGVMVTAYGIYFLIEAIS